MNDDVSMFQMQQPRLNRAQTTITKSEESKKLIATPIQQEPEAVEEEPRWTQQQIKDYCAQALKLVNDTTLGYVYASFPGKATWEMYYVVLKDCQMQFMPSVKHHAFISTYLVNRITIRKTKKYIAVPDNNKNG